MEKFTEKTIHSDKIYDGRIIKVQVDEVQLPNGKTSTRELVKHPGAVAVIPITEDRKILFAKQYRKPLEKTLIEIPAGLIEPDEDPEITAVRELEEETGYTTKNITYITSFYTSPGFSNELIYMYYTDELELLEQAVFGDEDEFIEVVALTLEEAKTYVTEQRIHDAKTIYAILYLQTLGLF